MNIMKQITTGLDRLAYDQCDDGGKQNWGEWENAPDVVRRSHQQMASVIVREVLRRIFDEQTLFEIEHADDSNACMEMIREDFERLGVEMSATPPMFYPEALQNLIFTRLKEAGAFPGIPATVRYEATGNEKKFKRVSIEAE